MTVKWLAIAGLLALERLSPPTSLGILLVRV